MATSLLADFAATQLSLLDSCAPFQVANY